MDELVIAVDPGREKCGLAVVHRNRGVLVRQVIPVAKLGDMVGECANRYQADTVVLGNRTSSRQAKAVLTNIRIVDKPLKVLLVDEHHSTDEARLRYWQENPPCGLWRLVPLGMRVPSEPVDDWVAVILAERYFST